MRDSSGEVTLFGAEAALLATKAEFLELARDTCSSKATAGPECGYLPTHSAGGGDELLLP